MITYVESDLFASPAKVLVNTVNTVGVMGKGIARDFKRIYPEMFDQYQHYCDRSMLDIGKLWLYKTSHKWILNFPTKRHWRNNSRMEYIEDGLEKFVDTYDSKGIVSVSFPMLGCGNGELDWSSEVQPLMEKYLGKLPIEIYIHLFRQNERRVPEHRSISEMTKWLRSEPRILPFFEFWDDVVNLADSKSEFTTLGDQTRFRVSSDLFRQNLNVEYDSFVFKIEKEILEDLWNQIRPSGYYTLRDLNVSSSKIENVIISFLRYLPYIRTIQISSLPDAAHWESGLLLSTQPSDNVSEPRPVLSA